MYSLIGPLHPPYLPSEPCVVCRSYPMPQPSDLTTIPCLCPAPHLSMALWGHPSAWTYPGSQWSYLECPFSPYLMLLTCPPFSVFITPLFCLLQHVPQCLFSCSLPPTQPLIPNPYLVHRVSFTKLQ